MVCAVMVRADRRRVGRGAAQIALLPAGAFAVHQLRYLLAFGGEAGLMLRQQGHSYLHSVVPWLVLLIALAVGAFLRSLGSAFSDQTSAPRFTVSFMGLWLACSAALICIYVCQESLEGLLVTGHPGGLIGIFGFGGWWSIPAAACVGLVLAAVFHGARWLVDEVALRCARSRSYRRRRVRPALRPPLASPASLAPLADGRSGRGPPL